MKNLTCISLMLMVLPTMAFADGADIGSYLTSANTSPVVDSGHSLGSVWVKMNPLTVTATGNKQKTYLSTSSGLLDFTINNQTGRYLYVNMSNSGMTPSNTQFVQILQQSNVSYNQQMGASTVPQGATVFFFITNIQPSSSSPYTSDLCSPTSSYSPVGIFNSSNPAYIQMTPTINTGMNSVTLTVTGSSAPFICAFTAN